MKCRRNLDQYTKEYGAKYAHLRILKENFLTESVVKIPEFAGISNQKMTDFIKKKLGYEDLEKDWQELRNIFEEKDKFLEKAKEIEIKLKKAFNRDINEEDFEYLFKSEEYNTIKTFAHSCKFMVRSTGKEDSKEFSNAGGNESVANVSFETKSLLEAIGTVVCSYVGQKSLQQRMEASERSGVRLELDLFMPVLIQKMIGEDPGNEDITKIPSSGVLFTIDPQGYLIDKNINLLLIQSTFGHNEGVVNSAKGIETDTYRIDTKTGEIYPVIRRKEHRIKPEEGKDLRNVENEENMISRSSLNLTQLRKLQELRKELLHIYGQEHQDAEFVFMGDELNIVQTRPLTHLNQVTDHTYISLDDFEKGSIQAELLIGNGGKVFDIKEKDEVIVAPNLGIALLEYDRMQEQDKKHHTQKAKNIKLILSQKTSPINSHEATIFFGDGKVVLISNNPGFENLIGKAWKKNLFMSAPNKD
jgi:hypothetical protein